MSNLAHWREVLKHLQEVEIPQAKDRIGRAAADGDWHENAEYEDAERQLELIEARIAQLKILIRDLEKQEGIKSQA